MPTKTETQPIDQIVVDLAKKEAALRKRAAELKRSRETWERIRIARSQKVAA